MASGVPVITSNNSSLKEIGEGIALLVDPKNTSEISDAMGRLSGDDVLRAEMLPVILVVLAFNFLGDGLRDAADPYK